MSWTKIRAEFGMGTCWEEGCEGQRERDERG